MTRNAPTRSAPRRGKPAPAPPPQPKPRPALAAVRVLRSQTLASIPWLVHGFSTRLGGTSKAFGGHALNLGLTPADSRAAVLRNRKLFLAAVSAASAPSRKPASDFSLVTLKQVHSDRIHLIEAGAHSRSHSDSYSNGAPLSGDGLITGVPGLMLAIQTADCVPVLVADRRRRVVGAFHAGWRGTAARVVEKGIGMMRARFGCRPQDLVAAIGPCIRGCCYSVGPEVVEAFISQFDYAPSLFHDVYDLDPIKQKYPMLFLTARAPGHSDLGPQTHLDLVEANRRQLLSAGVSPRKISGLEPRKKDELACCTSCRTDLLFSHRAEAGYTGRMLAVIGITPPSSHSR